MIKKTTTHLSSVGVALLLAAPSVYAACPTGTSTVDFTWAGAAAGNKAVWGFTDTSKTYTVNYTDTSGSPASVDITMSLRDPDKINVDSDARDAGNHKYDPAGGCLPSTGETSDEWAGNGSIIDPWDSDCNGQVSTLATGTNMAYGAGFLTWVSLSSHHNQEMFLDFSFSRPAMVMDKFTIGDIDSAGLKYESVPPMSIYERPGNSYQDEVGLFASMNGTDVPLIISQVGSTLTVTGQTIRSFYDTNIINNLLPTDPQGTVTVATTSPIDKFSIMYSNGEEDALDEQANPNLYSWWSGTHGATNGASDNHAVRVSGFTFCMAEPPKDFGDAPATYPTLKANNGANHLMSQQLYLGNCVDGDSDGQVTATPSGDDSATGSITYGTCATAGADEDAITPVSLTDGQTAPSINVKTHNTTGADATLACWIDYNGDKTFDNTTERASTTVANNATTATLTLPNVPATASTTTGGSTVMRCRLASTASEISNATGAANTGEIEDHPVTLTAAPPACATITNTTNVTKITETDSNAANNTASAAIQANCAVSKTDLKVTKTASKTTVRHGDTVTYTITLENDSDVIATAVKVGDNLPSSLTFVSATPSQGTFANGVWDVGNVAARAKLTLMLEVTVK
jgi:uncharacterized repeat protein (TIGR01451 family)